ncbi:MAG: hypothetical protein KBC38_01310 [Candidatus Pacebacteria bacterium]|nr:hypothetical protein [Candidatus Paceibacterota bacterium]MBP9840273.1 hypothetical protein [Candidatus Paceibacterota bacterium]
MALLMCRETGRKIQAGSLIHIAITTDGEMIGTICYPRVSNVLRADRNVYRAVNGEGINFFGGTCFVRDTKLYLAKNLRRGGFQFSVPRAAALRYFPNAMKGVFPDIVASETAPEPVIEVRGERELAL